MQYFRIHLCPRRIDFLLEDNPKELGWASIQRRKNPTTWEDRFGFDRRNSNVKKLCYGFSAIVTYDLSYLTIFRVQSYGKSPPLLMRLISRITRRELIAPLGLLSKVSTICPETICSYIYEI